MPRVATLDEGTIRSLITRADALGAVRRSLVALAVDEAVLPGELAMDLDAGEIHVKGAFLRGHRNVAFKVATGFPGNARSGSRSTMGSRSRWTRRRVRRLPS